MMSKKKPCKQGLITKKYVAMHTNYFQTLKWLYTPVP